jgi:hypothetical protein
VSANTVGGTRTLEFTAIEKIFGVSDSSDVRLDEVSYETLKATPAASGTPTAYAVKLMNDDSVTIEFDLTPTGVSTYYADGLTTLSTISGSTEPAFPESFHDILVYAVLSDELLKLEKLALAKEAEARKEKKLSALRLFMAVSAHRDFIVGSLQP